MTRFMGNIESLRSLPPAKAPLWRKHAQIYYFSTTLWDIEPTSIVWLSFVRPSASVDAPVSPKLACALLDLVLIGVRFLAIAPAPMNIDPPRQNIQDWNKRV